MSEHGMRLPDGVEARYAPVSEFRQDDDGDTLMGHAATFNDPYDVGPFREQIEPGAFEASIASDDVRALFNHDVNFPLGRTSSGTLELEEDDVGLLTRIDLPESADTIREAIERGDVDQMSFGFEVLDEDWDELEDGTELRTIREAKLWDVSPVTFPANPNTDVALRSREAWRESREDEPEDEPAETITVRLDVDDSVLREKLAELHRLAETIYGRLPENRQSDQDLRDRIRSALTEAFGGEDTFVWIEDTFLEENEVVYRREDDDDAALFRVGFEVAEDGTVGLLGEPVEVVRVTTYEEVGGPEGDEPEDDGEPEENSVDVDDRLRLARLEVAEMDAELAGSSG